METRVAKELLQQFFAQSALLVRQLRVQLREIGAHPQDLLLLGGLPPSLGARLLLLRDLPEFLVEG